MYTGLLHLHSILRYLALLLLVIAAINSFIGWLRKGTFGNSDKKMNLFALIGIHLQLLTGLALYFISPYVRFSGFSEIMQEKHLRFWTIEHISIMLIAVILITIGYSKVKKLNNPISKHRQTAIFYGLGLILILSAIPWPFSTLARPWFNF